MGHLVLLVQNQQQGLFSKNSPYYFPRYSTTFFRFSRIGRPWGAFLLAFPALLAERRVPGGAVEETAEEHRIDLPGLFLVFVHVPTVVKLEAFRDAHAVRTRHAIRASRAGDDDPLFKLFPDLPEQGEFFFGKRVRKPAFGGGDILSDLLWR